jgi:WhiB family redox-sensing transcriptional regulator
MSELDWFEKAQCKGLTHHFFGTCFEHPSVREPREAIAKSICMSCSAIVQCREYGRAHGERGVWGGESEDERHALGYIKDPLLGRRRRARIARESELAMRAG